MELGNLLAKWPEPRIESLINSVTAGDVERALSQTNRSIKDFAALISPQAQGYLEEMAREAHRLTSQHFGRTIRLYVPLYLSNICSSDCIYCSYSAMSGKREQRVILIPDRIHNE